MITKFLNWVLLVVLFVFSLLLVPKSTLAMDTATPSSSLQRYHITFPIPELGNCNNLDECKAFCDVSTNSQACSSFAKAKGFYNQNQSSLVQAAKTELGCDYGSTCKDFCSKIENMDKCKAFGEKYLKRSKVPSTNSPVLINILKRAKDLLGCDSVDSCKQLCSLPENKDKCMHLTSTVSSSEDKSTMCADFCSTNPQACRPKAQTSNGLQSRPVPVFKGPGSYTQLESACQSSGCTWSNYTCSCPTPSVFPSSTQ